MKIAVWRLICSRNGIRMDNSLRTLPRAKGLVLLLGAGLVCAFAHTGRSADAVSTGAAAPDTNVSQRVRQAWIANYGGSAGRPDSVKAVSFDGSGNCYITGESAETGSGLDIITCKYSADGRLAWTMRYNGPGNGDDQPVAMAIDSLGNVIVAGTSKGAGTGSDFVILKYSVLGLLSWTARYNGPAGKDDIASALALDATGSIYVTGAAQGTGDRFGYATVKYSTLGLRLWAARYTGPANLEDRAQAIDVDALGNAVVTGKSKNASNDFDIVTVKYSLLGGQSWAARFNGSVNRDDEGRAISMASDGSIYVAGIATLGSQSGTNGQDLVALKYSSNGTLHWQQSYNGPSGMADWAERAVLDSHANFIVAGTCTGFGGNLDYVTLKFSSAGVLAFSQIFDAGVGHDDIAHGLAVGPDDSIYVTGESGGDETRDAVTLKYSAAGVQQWRARAEGANDAVANAIAVASDQSVLIAGQSQASADGDFVTVKYSQPALPKILTQPLALAITIGNTAILTVVAVSTEPLFYQWRLNGVNIPGATNAILILNNVQSSQSGNYHVTIYNAAGSIDSDTAALTVNLLGLPFADDFEKAGTISALAGTGSGQNAAATRQAGEPLHAGRTTGHSLWLKWRAPATGIATFNTLGSGVDTVLAVYTGGTLQSLAPVAADDDSGLFLSSEVQFNATVGTDYYIAVDSVDAGGRILLTWLVDVTADRLPVLAVLSGGQTVGEGETATFSIGSDTTGLLFQWFFNGVQLPGATNSTLKIADVHSEQVGLYYVRVLGIRELLSQPAYLQINETDGSVARNVAALDKLSQLAASYTPNKSLRKSFTAAGGYSGTQVFSTVGATKDAGEPNHCGIAGGSSEWFAWTSPTNALCAFNTDGSSFDTVLAVYIGPGDSYSTLTNVACDDNSGSNGITSRVVFQAAKGTTYYIVVDGVNGAKGAVHLNYAVGAPPIITTQPQDRAAATNTPAALAVSAVASPAPIYQWSFEANDILRATNRALTISPVTSSTYGSYRVRITNPLGTVRSVSARLLQQEALRLKERLMSTNGFLMSVVGPAGSNYVLECSSNLMSWTPVYTNRNGSGVFDYVNPAAATNACSFFRVKSVP